MKFTHRLLGSLGVAVIVIGVAIDGESAVGAPFRQCNHEKCITTNCTANGHGACTYNSDTNKCEMSLDLPYATCGFTVLEKDCAESFPPNGIRCQHKVCPPGDAGTCTQAGLSACDSTNCSVSTYGDILPVCTHRDC